MINPFDFMIDTLAEKIAVRLRARPPERVVIELELCDIEFKNGKLTIRPKIDLPEAT